MKCLIETFYYCLTYVAIFINSIRYGIRLFYSAQNFGVICRPLPNTHNKTINKSIHTNPKTYKKKIISFLHTIEKTKIKTHFSTFYSIPLISALDSALPYSHSYKQLHIQ